MDKINSKNHLGSITKYFPEGSIKKSFINFHLTLELNFVLNKGTTIVDEELDSAKVADESKSLLDRITFSRPNHLEHTIQLCNDYSNKFKKV